MFITFCNWLFAEEEIGGELLVQLVEEGRSEHLQRLSKWLKDKLKFRKMLPTTAGTQPIPTTSCSSLHTVDRKLTISEMQSLHDSRREACLPNQGRHLYAMCWCVLATMAVNRRNKVRKTITKEWPGNEIPIFKGPANSKKNSDRLDQLV